ncbi:MAG: Asp-tRNA(Asn)/Glu-tRNA(Gln) amidotransferase subunit GatA [Fimbriimonadaceae bacterium]
MSLVNLTATELARKLAGREVSAVEVANAHLEAIATKNADYGAFLHVCKAEALEMAAIAQAKIDEGTAGPLTGVPIALKDNISTLGIPTTCASRILEGYIPPYDATIVKKIKDSGMVLLGKTNLDEFAMGTSTENSAFFPSRNPVDITRSPGGSSGGSAAAVAGNLSPLALGSDTGGSIRQPAALCGIVGFKPTYGRCSRYGLIAFASSLDQIGPLTRNVEDAAVLSSLLTGPDVNENTSIPMDPISIANLKSGSLRGVKVGLPKQFFGDSMDAGVLAAVNASIGKLQAEGVEFVELDLPSIQYGVTTYYIIAPAEASSNLGRFDGIRYGPQIEAKLGHIEMVERTRGQLFGHEVKARIMIGTYALSAGYYDAFYVKAIQVRDLMRLEFASAFESVDFVLGPTSPIPAFKLGELSGDPMALKLLDFCTIPANLLGAPAISIPCGLTNGLPVGLHLQADVGQDDKLLQFAYSVESVLG